MARFGGEIHQYKGSAKICREFRTTSNHRHTARSCGSQPGCEVAPGSVQEGNRQRFQPDPESSDGSTISAIVFSSQIEPAVKSALRV
jgi:hypothetical protein